MTFRSRRVVDGVLLFEGATWPRRVGWGYRAITFGHVVLSLEPIDEATFAHELVHVRQYERWGPFFVPAYIVASGVARSRGGHFYRDNRFEVAASHGSQSPSETPGS